MQPLKLIEESVDVVDRIERQDEQEERLEERIRALPESMTRTRSELMMVARR